MAATATFNRAEVIDRNFVEFLRGWSGPAVQRREMDAPLASDAAMTGRDLVELFESQMTARHLDVIARWLRARNASFYTIGSAGHEANAVVARLTRPTDPAFLHYRSGAFFVERARHFPEIDAVRDVVLSQAASADDPIAGGRHKVWGSAPMWILPQTSTIASHLPKAVGCAIAIRRGKQIGHELPVPPDSIVVCSFGDATVNHSTAQGALNAAAWAAYQFLPLPILFVCEDNGLGISVRTPPGWVEATIRARPGLRYLQADGLNLVECHRDVTRAVEYVRSHRAPTFLHVRMIRMLGHAGSDFEPAYHTMAEIAAAEAQDPLLSSARLVIEAGLLSAADILKRYEMVRQRVRAAADLAVSRPRLSSRAEIIAPLAPLDVEAVMAEARRVVPDSARAAGFGGADKLPERGEPRNLATSINAALVDLMIKYPQMVVFGEDVAQKGGVYYVTAGLHKKFKAARVFNTLLDEQTILGLAQGMGTMGMIPVPEIQYLAYFHNACDQIRGEACSLQFFSKNQFRNPMIVRIASLAYQKGFGGHFHNDNSIAALRDIPSLIVACPSRGDDAAAMLRTCAAMASVSGRVIAFLEPIALYMTKDLYDDGDGGWLFAYPPPPEAIPPGEPRVYQPRAKDLLIVTFGNGVPMSLKAARELKRARGIETRILDLRWLLPLNEEAILQHAGDIGRVVVVDEGRRSGGVSEAILALFAEHGDRRVQCGRVVGDDTYIPLGPAAECVLPSVDDIVQTSIELSR